METERKRAFIIHVAYYAILAAFFVALVGYGLPMLAPFVIGFAVAYILRRPTRFLARKLRLPYKPVALLMVLLFYCTVGLLIALLIIRAFSGVQSFIGLLPHIYDVHLLPGLTELFGRVEGLVFRMDESLFAVIAGFEEQFMAWLANAVSGLSGWAVSAVSGAAASIPGMFIKMVLMLISSFFIAADYDVLTGFCLRQLSDKSAELFWQIKRYLVGTLFVCIGSYAVIVTLTCIELTIGFTFIGLQHAFLIAALIALFDILPVLGTGGIMVPWAVISALRGDLALGLKLLVLYVVVTVVRNIVEPKIVGRQLGLHPVVTLASMFAGVQLFGVAGLFGFPIGLSLLRYLNEEGSIHIFKMSREDTAEDPAGL